MSDKNLRPADQTDKPEKKQDNSIEGSRRQNTRMILWGVAGAYLLYLAVKMLKDLAGGLVEGQSTKIMVVVASILFISAAVFMLVQCIRFAIRAFKSSVVNMAAAEDEDGEDSE